MEVGTIMAIANYVKNVLAEQGRSQRWLALKIGMNEKTLSGKFARNNFMGDELILIATELDFDLNHLKGYGDSLSQGDVYKVYVDAIDNAYFDAVVNSISVHLPELDKQFHPTLASVIIYMIECDISYPEFVDMMCSEYLPIWDLLENYYWYYAGITNDNELEMYATTQQRTDIILSLPRVFTKHGCLVFCEPPFTKFEDGKLCYAAPLQFENESEDRN